jgi:hypothetical protein
MSAYAVLSAVAAYAAIVENASSCTHTGHSVLLMQSGCA